MNPDAVHDSECEHNHERERTAVTDERQRHTGDRANCDSHPDILENVGENERGYPNHQKQTKLVAGKKRDEQTSQKQKGERADEKDAANKTPLLADRREDVVVVHSGGWQEPELDL